MRNKILLVEDSKVVQHMYRSKLTLEQFTVITADNGMEAIKLLSQEIPDLILLDLMRPVIDGYKVLQVIKTDPRLAGIPVLLFSARGQAEAAPSSVMNSRRFIGSPGAGHDRSFQDYHLGAARYRRMHPIGRPADRPAIKAGKLLTRVFDHGPRDEATPHSSRRRRHQPLKVG